MATSVPSYVKTVSRAQAGNTGLSRVDCPRDQIGPYTQAILRKLAPLGLAPTGKDGAGAIVFHAKAGKGKMVVMQNTGTTQFHGFDPIPVEEITEEDIASWNALKEQLAAAKVGEEF